MLCPTRWTVQAEALASTSDNYQSTWQAAKLATKDSEIKARSCCTNRILFWSRFREKAFGNSRHSFACSVKVKEQFKHFNLFVQLSSLTLFGSTLRKSHLI